MTRYDWEEIVIFIVWAIGVIINIAIIGGAFYVGSHFIAKYW